MPLSKEELILDIMSDLECTREEAEEVAELEIKSKGVKTYVESKPTKSRTKKVDEEKAKIVQALSETLIALGYSPTISTVDRTIDFGNMTITLTRHKGNA